MRGTFARAFSTGRTMSTITADWRCSRLRMCTTDALKNVSHNDNVFWRGVCDTSRALHCGPTDGEVATTRGLDQQARAGTTGHSNGHLSQQRQLPSRCSLNFFYDCLKLIDTHRARSATSHGSTLHLSTMTSRTVAVIPLPVIFCARSSSSVGIRTVIFRRSLHMA